MDTTVLHFQRSTQRQAWLLGCFVFGIVTLGGLFLVWTREPLIVRGVSINSQSVSGLTPEQATAKIETALPPLSETTITVSAYEKTWSTSSAQLGLHFDVNTAVQTAAHLGRQKSVAENSFERAELLAQPRNIEVKTQYDQDAVAQWVRAIAKDMDKPGKEPAIIPRGKSYDIVIGELGERLIQEELISAILENPQQVTFSAPIEPTVIPLSPDGLIRSQQRAEGLKNTILTLQVSDAEPPLTLSLSLFFPWMQLPEGWKTEKMKEYLLTLAEKLNRDPVDAQFEREGSALKLKTFRPQQTGRKLQVDQLQTEIQNKLNELEVLNGGRSEAEKPTTLTLPFENIAPQTTLESLNNLGVKERIGLGTSTFHGSIPNRVFNVGLTSQRLHATLVPPGEVFSFNKSVGEISRSTGYKTAYVISGGRTVLGDGGGVCQVSTTTFRAALNAGFPIQKWKPHSYRVGYYEQNTQPGFDATVYSPSTDFTFLNDTNHHIVIATYPDTESRHLAIEIWGTSDGRTAEIHDYTLSGQTGAPAPAYIPDPTLPQGTTKQVDWSAPGANAKFTYTVKNKDGSLRQERDFISRFQPWRAVFLVGTQ